MSEAAFGLVSSYGILTIFCATLLSCLAVPVPTSFIMLAGGGFAASGDLELVAVLFSALVGAVLGDQLGFFIGRVGGSRVSSWLKRSPNGRASYSSAERFLKKWGSASVFLSRWLISPLGPYVNLLAGAANFGWPSFTVWGVLGEVIWVGIYVALGYVFANQIGMLADVLGNSVAFLTAGAGAVVSGVLLVSRIRSDSRLEPEIR